jgi:hypothetical protein
MTAVILAFFDGRRCGTFVRCAVVGGDTNNGKNNKKRDLKLEIDYVNFVAIYGMSCRNEVKIRHTIYRNKI